MRVLSMSKKAITASGSADSSSPVMPKGYRDKVRRLGGVPRAELTLIGKPGCHLCDEARAAIMAVIADLKTRDASVDVVVSERSILDDAELYDEHVEDIPVVLINGKVHTFWRVDPARLT